MGDATVVKGNAGWTASKLDIPDHAMLTTASCRKDWKRIAAALSVMSPAEKTGKGLLQLCLSCLPDNPISQGAELKTEPSACQRRVFRACPDVLIVFQSGGYSQ